MAAEKKKATKPKKKATAKKKDASKPAKPRVSRPERTPKYDYDSKETFYDVIGKYASQGMTDTEIAYSMDLLPTTFSRMKHGKIEHWTKEQNERRSEQIRQVLASARARANGVVRAAYFRTAIGGKKIKTVTKRYVQARCLCNGENKDCHECGGTGWIVLTDKAIIQETESELPPNLQAQSNWLYQHDPEWRKISRGKEDEEPMKPAERDVDIMGWLEKEMQAGKSDIEKAAEEAKAQFLKELNEE
jgi:hypothetical protein